VDEVEIGYSLAQDFWGQGLATEVESALVEIGFRQCGLANIIAFASIGHGASRHVMEKVGFRFEKDRIIDDELCAVYRFFPS
jgi:RimJ/RimL family protein N-acetyltransferase